MSRKREPESSTKTPWLRIKRLDEYTYELEEVSDSETIKSIAKDVFPICLDKANERLLMNAGLL